MFSPSTNRNSTLTLLFQLLRCEVFMISPKMWLRLKTVQLGGSISKAPPNASFQQRRLPLAVLAALHHHSVLYLTDSDYEGQREKRLKKIKLLIWKLKWLRHDLISRFSSQKHSRPVDSKISTPRGFTVNVHLPNVPDEDHIQLISVGFSFNHRANLIMTSSGQRWQGFISAVNRELLVFPSSDTVLMFFMSNKSPLQL